MSRLKVTSKEIVKKHFFRFCICFSFIEKAVGFLLTYSFYVRPEVWKLVL